MASLMLRHAMTRYIAAHSAVVRADRSRGQGATDTQLAELAAATEEYRVAEQDEEDKMASTNKEESPMRKYRIVTVHRVVQTVRRSYEFDADGMAEVAAWLASDDLLSEHLGGEAIEESEQTLLEATITDVTHCYQEESDE